MKENKKTILFIIAAIACVALALLTAFFTVCLQLTGEVRLALLISWSAGGTIERFCMLIKALHAHKGFSRS